MHYRRYAWDRILGFVFVSYLDIYDSKMDIFQPFLPQVLHLADGNILGSRLVIDAMGNFSPVVKQVRLWLICQDF